MKAPPSLEPLKRLYRQRSKRLLGAAVAFWLLFVAALSLAPLPVKLFFHTIGPLHEAGHVAIFCISGAFLLSAAKSPIIRVVSLPVLFVFCAALELLQAVIYHQPFEWTDLWIDSFALVLAPTLLFVSQVSAHVARILFRTVKTEHGRHDFE